MAISILGVGALLELSAVGWVFFSKFRTSRPASDGLAIDGGNPARDFNDPFVADEPGVSPMGASPSIVTIPAKPAPNAQFPFKPVPITPEAPPPAAAQPDSRFNELVEQARTLRERGDTSTAITRFREALALEPQNPMPMAEIATTFEKMGAADKAAENWRRIYDMGESAGVYFTAAEAKMKASQAQAILQAMPAAAPQDLANAAAAMRSVPTAAPEATGFAPGSRLALGDPSRREENDPLSMRKFTVQIPIKAKPRVRIDVRDVTIQVLFYDVLNGRTLDKTNAEVSTRWANPPADWSDDDVEMLEVSYRQTPAPQGEPTENRKFYGYLVRVYYKDALQDTRAEPARLGQTFPAPRMLQPDSAQ